MFGRRICLCCHKDADPVCVVFKHFDLPFDFVEMLCDQIGKKCGRRVRATPEPDD